ncbi:MAG: 30S ribosomal protein S6 [Sandaracinaceae bacterium]
MTAARKLAREYELVYILRPTVTPSEARKVSDRVNDVITKLDAKLTLVDNWGKRKLAYTIKTSAGRFTRGIFIYVKCVGYDGLVLEMERNLRLLDDVIRFQTIRLETLYDLGELTVDPEEVEFKDIEVSEEEDVDPTFEETLGMRPRPPRPPREEPKPAEKPEEAKAEGESTEAKAEGESTEAKAEGEAEAAPAAEATPAADSAEKE